MGKIFTWILSWFGGGPLGKIIDGLNKAYSDRLNAKTETETIESNERIDHFKAIYADLNSARQSAAAMPWWMGMLAVIIGMPFAIHVFLIGVGTWWVAPHDWVISCRCYIDGTGWLEWTRHIPPFPAPFDLREADVIGYFYGFGAAVVVGTSAVKVVQHVLAKRR